MSPALAPVTSPIAQIPSLPIIDQWSNPLPDNFKYLDGRRIYLISESNRKLEMHPNGVRGVKEFTEYCLLTVLLYTINDVALGPGWGENKGQSGIGGFMGGGGHLDSFHVLRANKTGSYLCMDDHSVPYQTQKFDSDHCKFSHRQDKETGYADTYYREVNGSKWYVGLNRDGSVRCGNVTRRTQKSARFHKTFESNVDQKPPVPFKELRKPCCPKSKCKKKSRRNRKCPENRKSKRWCKKKRRQFFQLTLKELKRYYNKCILQKEKIRHCKDR